MNYNDFIPLQIPPYHIVFEHDDKASKNFDLLILGLILGSLVVVILDSEPIGIVTSELTAVKSISSPRQQDKSCKTCKAHHLDNDSSYCKFCGEML